MSSFVREGPKAWQLVPHITFVNFDSVLLAQQTKLILIGELRMVRFLILDVTLDFVQIGITHRKYAVSGLPRKSLISLGDTFRPFGSFRLDHFNELANLQCSRQPNEQMDMIDVSADDRDNAPSLSNVMSQHAKHLVTKFRIF